MHIPRPGQKSTTEDTAKVMLNENESFGFCKKFKYLVTHFDDSMDDSEEIKKRIQKATAGFAVMKNLLQNKSIPIILRKRTYDATVLNILLFGCESWALKKKDRNKLEACHHKFLRAMLNLSMMDVKELRITNEMVRNELNSYAIWQIMELRRAKWLQKLALMPKSRNPRKLFVSWIRTPRRTGRPRQTIRHGYADTIGITSNMEKETVLSIIGWKMQKI